MITAEELKQLKDSLPRGYGDLLAKRTGLSKNFCYQVLSTTKSYNEAVILEAIKIAEETNELRKQVRDSFKKLQEDRA